MKITCIVSFHTNPYTCGVARFNRALADELQVPLFSIKSFSESPLSGALISVKFDEMSAEATTQLGSALLGDKKDFDLLLHDVHKSPEEILFCREARVVYAATSELRDKLAGVRSDAISAFAPGAHVVIQPPKFDLTLITFGMAHKIRSERYQALGKLSFPVLESLLGRANHFLLHNLMVLASLKPHMSIALTHARS